jgi:tagaturonate reductase
MRQLNRKTADGAQAYPERVLQYGEGNFLRAFVDWMIDRMNKQAGFNSGVTVVQPIPQGLAETLNAQDGLYHLYLQGVKDGKTVSEHTRIDCINRALNPYTQYTEYLKIAENPVLRFIVSNTTEAGIAYDGKDTAEMQPQNSFPGKLTAFLYRRFQAFGGAADKGLIIICCELIERNACMLKKHVLQHAQNWELEPAFIQWVNTANAFCSTLVDRIVPGFPKNKIGEIHRQLGFGDQLVVEGEYFHLWVIEAPSWVEREFPARQSGLNVIFTGDMTPYRDLKVRILNGAHTASFAVSLLAGVETVRESVEHPQINRFMSDMVAEEICPHIRHTEIKPTAYAGQVWERFHNPFIKHFWKSIALNSVSKWQARVLPSLIDHHLNTGAIPERLAFSLAALIGYYRGEYQTRPIHVDDGAEIVSFFRSAWSGFVPDADSALKLSRAVLGNTAIWKKDLNDIAGLTESVADYVLKIQQLGVLEALAQLSPSRVRYKELV